MSNDNGVTFELSSIDTALLISGQPYQRPVREGRLRELTRDIIHLRSIRCKNGWNTGRI